MHHFRYIQNIPCICIYCVLIMTSIKDPFLMRGSMHKCGLCCGLVCAHLAGFVRHIRVLYQYE